MQSRETRGGGGCKINFLLIIDVWRKKNNHKKRGRKNPREVTANLGNTHASIPVTH